MNKTRNAIIILFIFLLIMSIVTYDVEATYEIPPLENEYYQFTQAQNFNFHVYNESDGLPIQSGIDCFFFLYDSSNNLLFQGNDSLPDSYSYSFSINNSIVNSAGDFPYTMACNSSLHGGYISDTLIFSKQGLPEQELSLSIFLYYIFLIVFFIFIGIPHKPGATKIAAWGMSLIQILLMIWIVYIQKVGGNINDLMYWDLIIMTILASFIGLLTLIKVNVNLMKLDDEEKDEDPYLKWLTK